MDKSVEIFFCYAHEDKKMLNELKKHLMPFQKVGAVEIWHDADISAGVEWEPEIVKHLNSAHIILLLISADFLASDYCYGTELKRAIERHKLKLARVIPIILRPVYWKTVESLRKLQVLPIDGVAVTTWPNTDSAYENISEGLAAVIKELSIHASPKASEQLEQEHLKTEVQGTLPNVSGTPKTSVPLQHKKALLVLTGGRAFPDILTLLYLQPQLVVVIAPQEGWPFEQTFLDITETLPDCTVEPIRKVDAFNIEACMQACVEVYLQFPDWDWTVTTSSSTKIMGLAAYEFAKQKGISCLQVDVSHEKVISLVQKKEVDIRRFFHLTIDQYVKNYGLTAVNTSLVNSDYEIKITALSDIAREMVYSSDTETFQQLLKLPHRDEIINIALPPELKTSTLLQPLEKAGLLKIMQRSNNDTIVSLSYEAVRFLTGDWLEFYVWHEVIKAGFADDCRRGFRISKEKVQFEIDVALTYKARLLIAECKSGRLPFQDDYLSSLDSIANILGGGYVSKVFITNQSGIGDRFKFFTERAMMRNIVVVTKEDLPKISHIFKREMINPKYARI